MGSTRISQVILKDISETLILPQDRSLIDSDGILNRSIRKQSNKNSV